MKFSCERCGKKYASADTLAPGRVYKLRCKACGHLIVVRASAGMATIADGPGGAGAVAGRASAPGPADRANGAPAGAPQTRGEETSQIAFALATPPPLPSAADAGEPPAGDAGYVDLFADLDSPEASARSTDPFLAAARASLPEAYGGRADPFAPLERERPTAPPLAPAPAPRIPEIPKPPVQKSSLPIALIGGGVAVLVGILAFVLLGSAKKAPAAPPAPAAAPIEATAPPAPPPAPAVSTAEAPAVAAAGAAPMEPAPAAPAATPERTSPPVDARRRREEHRRRDREAAQVRDQRARERREREEREGAERARRERERPAAVAAVQEEAGVGLTRAQIETVLRSTKKAFDACLREARGGDTRLDGRRVTLLLNIQPSGTVTYPTLDDVTLNGTVVGSCLKSAARLMVFPRFKGDTLHVEVPLVMQ